MANDPTSSARRADRALDATGQNLRQAQQRLTALLAAARLAANVRTRRLATAAAASAAR